MSILEISNNIIEDLPKSKFEKATNYLEILNMSCEIIEIASTKTKNRNVTSEEKRECAVVIVKNLTNKISSLGIINNNLEKDILTFIESHEDLYNTIDSVIDILNSASKNCCKGNRKIKTRYL